MDEPFTNEVPQLSSIIDAAELYTEEMDRF